MLLVNIKELVGVEEDGLLLKKGARCPGQEELPTLSF